MTQETLTQSQISKSTDLVQIIDEWEISPESLVLDSLDESVDPVIIDGQYVIGRVVGECFFPGKSSRNKRFYSEKLWTRCLADPEVKEMLSSRSMMGTVGHKQPLDEEAILSGKITHLTNNLWIDENGRGMGEFLILGTTGGRNLYTHLKAKQKLKFSTRAKGKYSDKKTPTGDPIIHEESFQLKGVDFVLDPGFLEAKPELVESQENTSTSESAEKSKGSEESEMADGMQEHLTNELSQVRSQRDDLLVKTESLQSTVTNLEAQLKSLVEQVEADKQKKIEESQELLTSYTELGSVDEIKAKLESVDATEKEVQDAFESVIRLKQVYDTYGFNIWEELIAALDERKSILEEFGTKDEIDSAFNKVSSLFEELGSPEVLREKLASVDSLIGDMDEALVRASLEEYSKFVEEFGTIDECDKVYSLTEDFIKENGSFSNVAKALEESVAFHEEFGSAQDIRAVFDSLKEFTEEYGSISSIKTALTAMYQKIEEEKRTKHEEMLKSLSESTKIPEAQIEKMLAIMSVDEIAKFNFTESADSDEEESDDDIKTDKNPKKTPITGSDEDEEDDKDSMTENFKGSAYLMGGAPSSRYQRMEENKSGESRGKSLSSKLMNG